MAYRTRIYYTEEQKAEMWDRWQRGESLKAIGRAFDRGSSSIFGQLTPTGGIRPKPRKRSRLALTLCEREEISRVLAGYLSLRTIAAQLSRSPSTVSREIQRNGGYDSYRAAQADQAAWDRTCRPKRCKLAYYRSLRRAVTTKLRLNWSPEQIAGLDEKRTSRRRTQASVIRDHLSQSVHSGPGRAKKGITSAP